MSPEGYRGSEGWRTSTSPLLREVELFNLEKRRVQGRYSVVAHYLKGPTKELERDFLHGYVVLGQGDDDFTLKEVRFR